MNTYTRTGLLSFTLICLFCISLPSMAQKTPTLKTAKNHPIQYYLSLPDNWSSNGNYPIVVISEAAEKEFKVNAERFIEARKNMPFIIVAPIITTNGNYGQHDPKIYPYSKATWDQIDREGNCQFDLTGLKEIIQNVQQEYHGSSKIFISGFEAGAHLVWATTLLHPEWLYAAATVGGNFRNRCVSANEISSDPSRVKLPLLNFVGSRDTLFGKPSKLYYQYNDAKKLASEHGYTNFSETILPIDHIPVTTEVLQAFYSIWQRNSTDK